MSAKILPLLLLHAFPGSALAIGLDPKNASNVQIIEYVSIFIVSCLLLFFLLIRLTIIPFLVRNYYSLADATNIGLSLFILYALNIFTLLFFRYALVRSWWAVFIVIAIFWMIHLLLKVLLTRRNQE